MPLPRFCEKEDPLPLFSPFSNFFFLFSPKLIPKINFSTQNSIFFENFFNFFAKKCILGIFRPPKRPFAPFCNTPDSVNLRKGGSVGATPTEYVVVTPRHHGVNLRIPDTFSLGGSSGTLGALGFLLPSPCL